jgi:hypothetical protein
MGQVKKHSAVDATSEQAMREQEVLRANKELAAYFKGLRTEREARAALKIIKAFVRERERKDVKSRPPLPRGRTARTASPPTRRTTATSGKSRRATVAARAKPAQKKPERTEAASDAPASSDAGSLETV